MNNTYISLTTVYGRLDLVRYTLESLIRQKVTANKIFLNISKEPYLIDKGINDYPSWLIELENNNNLEISIVKNIGPYRKLIPLIKKLKKDDNIIICDDDVIYGKDWLKVLLETSSEYPNDIICMHSRKIKRMFRKSIDMSYIHWPIFYGREAQYNVLPIGVGGVLYKAKFFDLKFLLNNNFLQIAPVNDDLWFWYSCNNNNRMITAVKPNNIGYFFPIETLSNLTQLNYAVSSRFNSFLINKLNYIAGWFGKSVVRNDTAWRAISKFKKQINKH